MTSTDLHHTVRDGFCTTCGETEEWLTQQGADFERVTEAKDDGLPMSGVRNDAAHALRVDRTLAWNATEKRTFWCTCGRNFGSLYDTTARRAYRAHRKEALG